MPQPRPGLCGARLAGRRTSERLSRYGKNIIRLTRENAVAGRIFSVYDDEIRAGVALDAAEQAVKRVDTRLTDHIADD